jgi:hypothetical protein
MAEAPVRIGDDLLLALIDAIIEFDHKARGLRRRRLHIAELAKPPRDKIGILRELQPASIAGVSRLYRESLALRCRHCLEPRDLRRETGCAGTERQGCRRQGDGEKLFR